MTSDRSRACTLPPDTPLFHKSDDKIAKEAAAQASFEWLNQAHFSSGISYIRQLREPVREAIQALDGAATAVAGLIERARSGGGFDTIAPPTNLWGSSRASSYPDRCDRLP